MVPNCQPTDWTSKPVKVIHLLEYARYRTKAGVKEGLEAGEIIRKIAARQVGWVTFSYISQGADDKTLAILRDAYAFVLDLYDELEAPGP